MEDHVGNNRGQRPRLQLGSAVPFLRSGRLTQHTRHRLMKFPQRERFRETDPGVFLQEFLETFFDHVTGHEQHAFRGGGIFHLQFLKEGNAVPVDFQATIASGTRQNVVERLVERFVVSYDLWEERYMVKQQLGQRKSASHLTALQAEAWCFENLGMSLARVPKDQPMYVKFEIRTDDSGLRTPLFNAADTFNLTALINLLSRPPERQQWHWTGEVGPFSYADLKQSM